MNPQELRRKQVEEIVKQYHNNKGRCNCHDGEKCWPCSLTEAILALLSDAECKGAWAVVNRLGKTMLEMERECLEKGVTELRFPRRKHPLVKAARQVAESFGPDPEGEEV